MQRVCRESGVRFEISPLEEALLDRLSPVIGGNKYSLPPPSLSPEARLQRRIAWRPELSLFFRKSDLSGKRMVSYLPPESDSVVYTLEEWLSDSWDALSYGVEYDFSKSLFEQIAKLRLLVPQPGTAVLNNENSDYTNSASYCKDCYLLAGSSSDEQCLYGTYVNGSNHCVDNCFIFGCELCYECIDCKNCYALKYSWNCVDCADSQFLHSCRSTRNCFGSVNLVRAEYVFFNEQLTKNEYEARVEALHLETLSGRESAKRLFEAHRLKFPYRAYIGEMNEGVSGNVIHNSKNCESCFDVTNLEDCAHCVWFHNARDCLDCYAWGKPAELCYNSVAIGDNAVRNICCWQCYGSSSVYYSLQLRNCKDCFGCISLRNKQYCVFNVQYNKADYEKLVGQIVQQLLDRGEWGEFFPPSISPLFYNNTAGADYFPMEREAAIASGYRWYEEGEVDKSVDLVANCVAAPDSILDLTDSLLSTALSCEQTGKPFKITAQELAFYRANSIPIPASSYQSRHKARLSKRLPWTVAPRSCDKCGTSILSAYRSCARESVICDRCYSKEM